MRRLAVAPPVVTNLQQNFGMKRKKTDCVDNSLVQVTLKKLYFYFSIYFLFLWSLTI